MEFVRRPTVLAAIAAAVLAFNVLVLATDDDNGDGDERTISDVLEDRREELGGQPGEDGETTDGTSPDAADPDGEGTTDGTDSGGTGDTGETGDATDDGPTDDDDAADADGELAETNGRGALAAPTTGTYTYASSGNWSLTGRDEPVERQLPATATATVTGGGNDWSVELVAGSMYADRFTFSIGADGALDWDGWDLDRDFGRGIETTPYDCSGDSAYYLNDADPGRTSQHGCTTASATSSGTIEYVGVEDVTLGDGTVVAADRLLYTYTVTGSGVTGDGRLDLWLDPGTGLRVREQRQIDTTTTSQGTDFVYSEDVQFLLQSLDAA